ncbi:hypothetical protein [Actinomycetospora aeridis]|uniref:Uncharacterized protein n=1 Tax=Actinomycetospora aeridis TaxID=3129231 RepID=A0ABU8MY40_9PSEU
MTTTPMPELSPTEEAPRAERVRQAGPAGVSLPIPWLGTIELSRPELAFVGGIAGLTALGLLEWPIALVMAGGHVLAADRSSRTVRDLGDAMTEA